MKIQDRDHPSQGLLSAIAIVAAAYAVNAVFNHTAWGLHMKAFGDLYVFGFFLPFGVTVPAAYIGWTVNLRRASPRWLGVQVGWRDAVAAAIALVVGGFLAVGALTSEGGDLGSVPVPHRLFALLLVASMAEVLLFLGVLGNAVELALSAGHPWRSRLIAFVVSSIAFGFFHFTYPAPWNTLGHALGLTLVWVPVALLFLLTRSLIGAVFLNNLMALIGFVRNDLDLPGTIADGWLQAILACVVFVGVVRLMTRHRQTAT